MEPRLESRPGMLRRRLNRRWRKQRAFAGLLVLPFVAVLAIPAPVAQAQPAPAAQAASPAPGPCLLGVFLCGQNIVQNPAPCVVGVLCTPAPLPSICVGGAVLCDGALASQPNVVPTTSSSPGAPTARQTANPTTTGTGPRTATGGGSATVPAAGQAPLLAPPGVGLVIPAPVAASAAVAGPSPDPLAVLLSLSIRDGLSVSSYSIWPWLAGLQLALLLAMIAAVCSRQLTAASKPAS